jgi:hypothetical protein
LAGFRAPACAVLLYLLPFWPAKRAFCARLIFRRVAADIVRFFGKDGDMTVLTDFMTRDCFPFNASSAASTLSSWAVIEFLSFLSCSIIESIRNSFLLVDFIFVVVLLIALQNLAAHPVLAGHHEFPVELKRTGFLHPDKQLHDTYLEPEFYPFAR